MNQLYSYQDELTIRINDHRRRSDILDIYQTHGICLIGHSGSLSQRYLLDNRRLVKTRSSLGWAGILHKKHFICLLGPFCY